MMSCIFAGRKGRVAWQPPFQKKKMEKIAAKVASLAFVFCRPHSPSNGTSTKKKKTAAKEIAVKAISTGR